MKPILLMDNPRKYGHLAVIRGGLSRELSPIEQLQRDVRSWAARGKVNGDGKYAARCLADIATDVRRVPLSTTARAITEGLEGGASPEWAEELLPCLAKYIHAETRRLCRPRASQPDRAA